MSHLLVFPDLSDELQAAQVTGEQSQTSDEDDSVLLSETEPPIVPSVVRRRVLKSVVVIHTLV